MSGKSASGLRERVQRIYNYKSSRWVYRTARRVIILVMFPYFRLRSRGTDNLDIEGAVILAPVHRSNFDAPLMGGLASRPFRSLAKEQLFSNWILAWFMASLGAFPVNRNKIDRNALRVAEQTLQEGKQLLVFPEGTRQKGPRVVGVFDGVAYLASKTGASIVPVGIAGTEKIMRKSKFLPGRPRVAAVFGVPMHVEKRRMRHLELKSLSDDLKQRLQVAFDEAQVLTQALDHPPEHW